jgi:hypothetical protein
MVGKTTMNLHNESTPAQPNGVAKDVGELTSDVMSLAQLQLELFTTDCRTGMRGLLTPVVLLLGAGLAALGTVPVVLLLLAETLVRVAGFSQLAALSTAALERAICGNCPGNCGVVPGPRSRAGVPAFPRRIDPQSELDQALAARAGSAGSPATSGRRSDRAGISCSIPK